MTIKPASGLITWTPSEAQGPSTNLISVVVTDNGVPALSNTNSFTVVVTEVNSTPLLTAIPDRMIAEGTLLSITATAVDPDFPVNALTFALDGVIPSGMTINPTSG